MEVVGAWPARPGFGIRGRSPAQCVFRTIANTKIGPSRTRRSEHREREDRTIANTKIGPS